ncbi:mRNA capping enzyme, catalytic domain-containing protein [Sphaerosporella brunnea]|uniref:mRNA-capping enzyme subunit alpha n=1 Tax=Sphaerosporella brunnea TaxID=1250544 RepID=A0A5J5EYX6_9PEZI|nr:mRNA capping enzyme, catalytic domain-containing protein [Sphaerosporella brunnea]
MAQTQPTRRAPHQSSVPEIPGFKAEGDLLRTLRREVADLLERSNLSFPGAQPVSFCRRHINELKRDDYYLCEKSDGIRCLMYFTRDGDREIHYLIDRKNDYYYVPDLHFPVPGDKTYQKFHTDTIIDGELVLDTIAPGKRLLRYLVFDCLVIDRKPMRERTLDKRLAYFREFVYTPYKDLCRIYPGEVQYFPFQLEFKKMEFSYAIELMFRDILPKLPHGNDGLIFTCRTSPYTFGTDTKILKWKPAEENSVDFRLKLEFPTISRADLEPESDEDDAESDTESVVVDYNSKPTFNLSVYHGDSTYEKFGVMYVTDEEWENLKSLGQPLDEEIVECRMDEQHRWKFMRFRKDKKDANHISTVNSVIESIEDAVEQDELVRNAWEIRDAWKKRNAPPQQTAAK